MISRKKKFNKMKDHLIDIAYLAFGRHTGISKAWFGLFLYIATSGIMVTILSLIINQ
jgi:hypothetical protein